MEAVVKTILLDLAQADGDGLGNLRAEPSDLLSMLPSHSIGITLQREG
jgi:hypothetical protein